MRHRSILHSGSRSEVEQRLVQEFGLTGEHLNAVFCGRDERKHIWKQLRDVNFSKEAATIESSNAGTQKTDLLVT